jgi:hypothetical protein
MNYALSSSSLLMILFFTYASVEAQTLDTADNASMAESMDSAAQAFEKMKAQYRAASPDGYKQWAELRHFNISYNAPPKAAAAGKIAAGPQPAAPQQQAKTPSYTYIFQTKDSTSPCGGLVFALRRDMSDLGLSECPTPFDSGSVKGALFSYGGDAVKHNNTFTAQALGALNYSWEGFDPNNHFFQPIYTSAGIYGSTNTILNSSKSLTKNDTEVYTYGLLGSLGIAPPNRGLYQNFTFSAGGVSNDVTYTNAFSEAIRYTTAWGDLWLAKPIPINPLPLFTALRSQPHWSV